MEINFSQDVQVALSFIDECDRAAYIRNAVKLQLARDGRLGATVGATTNQGASSTKAINPATAILQRIAIARQVPFTEILDEFNSAKSANLEADSIDIANQMYLKIVNQ